MQVASAGCVVANDSESDRDNAKKNERPSVEAARWMSRQEPTQYTVALDGARLPHHDAHSDDSEDPTTDQVHHVLWLPNTAVNCVRNVR